VIADAQCRGAESSRVLGIAVPPSTEKFTVPVGVPPWLPDTVAVKVTD
jgi:hypothetical protein